MRSLGSSACAFALAIVAALAIGGSAAAAVQPRVSLPDLESEVMCVLCKIPLSVADAPEADAERRFISALIARGETKTEIKRALVAQYGEAVLAAPKAKGFGLAAYLVPLLAILAAVGALAVLWPRWRGAARRRNAAPVSALPPLPAADSKRLDEELASFD